VIEQQFGIEI
jgi:hypothetical protein